MTAADKSISVLELNQRLSNAIAVAPDVHNVWVVGETSDMRQSGGHCYLELVEKADDGSNRSRIRATVWANAFRRINASFKAVTGVALASNMKIRVCVSASYHPTYGMAVNITDIDPVYTTGDAMRRRLEIVERLTAEGIIDLNKNLSWSQAPNRVAVISARGAAGYGDFITHLFTHPAHLRFSVDLYEAVMQGERTVPTVLEALQKIAACADRYDTVVIIRGGGATTDLAAFDNYDLAAAVARFPLPVIIGIGHERDTTVLDYVANMRVKTPTAAAEWLIDRVARLLDAFGRAADRIYQLALERISANRELLAHAQALVPGLARQHILTSATRLERYALTINSTVASTVAAHANRLDRCAADVRTAATRTLERANERLNRSQALLNVLSPDAVLARGFSLTTLADGRVVKCADQAPAGTTVITRLASGYLTSVTVNTNEK